MKERECYNCRYLYRNIESPQKPCSDCLLSVGEYPLWEAKLKKKKEENKMGFQKLIEWTDEQLKGELNDYYIVTKDRMDNLISCFVQQVGHIKGLTKMVDEQQEQLAKLQNYIIKGE